MTSATLDHERRMALQRNISARLLRLADLGVDELDVVDAFVSRLETGLANYGALDLRRDTRDWRREADDEIADYAVYRALARVAKRQQQVDAIESSLDELSEAKP